MKTLKYALRVIMWPVVSLLVVIVSLPIFVVAMGYFTIDFWIHPPPCKSCPEYGLGDCIGCEYLRKARL